MFIACFHCTIFINENNYIFLLTELKDKPTPVDEEVDKDKSEPREERPSRPDEAVVSQFDIEQPQEANEVAPEFVELLQPQIIPDGEEVTLTCRVEGSPFPHVTWYKQSQEIQPSTDFNMSVEPETGLVTLTIPEVFPEDAGEYAVRAVNPFGESITTANLLVHSK